MPLHKAGCDGTEMDGPCAACLWLTERDLEYHAWMRFQALFWNVPFDSYRPHGMGLG